MLHVESVGIRLAEPAGNGGHERFEQFAAYIEEGDAGGAEQDGNDRVPHGPTFLTAEWRELYKHALRNAILPFVTIIGLDMAFLLGGALVTESVFAWPGMGKLLIDSIYRLDRPVVVAWLMIVVMMFIVINLLVDLSYSLIDPRIRLQDVKA